jgi:REase_MTES_1575/Transcriptional regulator, AbiEi antitoxin
MTAKAHRNGKRGIATVAERQHGVVSRRQLRALGLSDEMVDARLASGWLQPIFRGVFAVGHRAIGRPGLALAAVLACGEGAVLSHATAAELLGLWDRRPRLIDVTSPSGSGRKVQGIRWHGPRRLARDEVIVHLGVPCTTAARTLVDMAGQYGEKTLCRLVEQAAVLRLLDIDAIDRILVRQRRRGAPMLRRILAPWRRRTVGQRRDRLRSRMEARMLAASLEAGVPPPRCNVRTEIEGRRFELDFLWEEQRLVVETDGEETHGTPMAFREDRRRDQILTANGYRVARIAWSQLEDEPAATMARIRRILQARPSGAPYPSMRRQRRTGRPFMPG